jgi:MFS superfamily sulfate permease-like transporter
MAAADRTSLNINIGVRNRVSSVLNAIGTVIFWYAFLPLPYYFPMPVVACVVVFAAYRVANGILATINWSISDRKTAVLAVTFVGCVVADVTIGLLVGSLASAFVQFGTVADGPAVVKVFASPVADNEKVVGKGACQMFIVNVTALDGIDFPSTIQSQFEIYVSSGPASVIASPTSATASPTDNHYTYQAIGTEADNQSSGGGASGSSTTAAYFSCPARANYGGAAPAYPPTSTDSVVVESLPVQTSEHYNSGYVSTPPVWSTDASKTYTLVYSIQDHFTVANCTAHVDRMKKVIARLELIKNVVISLRDVFVHDTEGIIALREIYLLCRAASVNCSLEFPKYRQLNAEATAFHRELRKSGQAVEDWSECHCRPYTANGHMLGQTQENLNDTIINL